MFCSPTENVENIAKQYTMTSWQCLETTPSYHHIWREILYHVSNLT